MTSFLSMEMKRMLRIGLQIKLLLKKSSQNLVEQNKHFLLFIDSVGQEIGCLMVERFVSVPQGLEPIQEALNAGIMSCIGLGIVWRHLSSCSWQLIWTNCWNTYTRPFCGTLASSHHGSLRIVKFLTKAAQGHEGVSTYQIEDALLVITWTQKFQGISSAYSVSHGGGGLVTKSCSTKER